MSANIALYAGTGLGIYYLITAPEIVADVALKSAIGLTITAASTAFGVYNGFCIGGQVGEHYAKKYKLLGSFEIPLGMFAGVITGGVAGVGGGLVVSSIICKGA